LIDGLAVLGVEINLFIYGDLQIGYQVKNCKKYVENNGLNFKYLGSRVVNEFLEQRYLIYLVSEFKKLKLSDFILQELQYIND
jgi:hypothetical protein